MEVGFGCKAALCSRLLSGLDSTLPGWRRRTALQARYSPLCGTAVRAGLGSASWARRGETVVGEENVKERDASTGGRSASKYATADPSQRITWCGEFSEFMHKEPNCVERCLTVGSVTDVKAQKWWRIQDLAESNSPTHNITTGLVVILIVPKDKGGMAVKTKSVDKSCRDETGFKHRSHRPKVHLSSGLGQFNQRLSLSDQINRGLKK